MWDEQIEYLHRQMDGLHDAIDRLEERRQQCEEALDRVDREQVEYTETCSLQKRKAIELYDNFPKVRVARYCGLYSELLLDGCEYKKVICGFEELRESICMQKNQTEDDMQECYRQIAELEWQIAEVQRQRELERIG